MSSGNVYSGSIAIVGGGIGGLCTAISLMKRGFNITIYEAAHHFGEIGAGVAFNAFAERAMTKIDPEVYKGYDRVVTRNLSPEKAKTYFEFFDGRDEKPASRATRLFDFKSGTGATGVHRAEFLDEMIKQVPEGMAHFGKKLRTIEGPDAEYKYTLHFVDGTSAVHDAIIGADGIKSAVRRWMVGDDSPSAHPVYTHKYAYRGLIPMDKAIAELGEDIAADAKIYMGDNAHMLTFPVSKGAVMNVVAFATDSGDWPDHEHLTRHSTKEQVRHDFAGFGTTVKKIIDMLEPALDCWAIFDSGDAPLPRYNKGKVLVLGDAAHATSPHHGSGASMAIEDAALLGELLLDPLVAANGERGLELAFEAFSAERLLRTQRLVQSSRRAGELCENRTDFAWDIGMIKKELRWRYLYLWDGQLDQFVATAKYYLADLLADPDL